jgi:hypothetical protein
LASFGLACRLSPFVGDLEVVVQVEKVVETSKGMALGVGALRRTAGSGFKALRHESRRRRRRANALVVASLVGLAGLVAVLARLLT